MSPGDRRPDDLWTQDTDVFPAVTGYGPAPTRPPSARSSSRSGRYVIVGLVAALAVAVLALGGVLVAGHFGKHTAPATNAAPSVKPTAAPTTSASAAPSGPPAAGAPLSAVVAWVKAGTSVDASTFHTATATDGTVNDLGSAIAFLSPSKKIRCMTPKVVTGYWQGLTCMATLDNPPARPKSRAEGEWVGGWVDYPGTTLGIGHLEGDPGQFTLGDGNILNYGSRLTFDNYDCRMDQTGLLCVDQTAGSAMQLSSSGAVPFGCLGKATTSNYGIAYSCTASDSTSTTKHAPPGESRALAGQPCDTPGQKSKSAGGVVLTCDVAGDSGYKWLAE
ncbi:hypothetical protein ACIP5Y_01850 [Nocardia sp. NPDC088792]|uniref:hypothetical protein n=1 Tax=Nocardia sp. NPDC088792 TaxID=3364332 RepID=UPI00381F0D39